MDESAAGKGSDLCPPFLIGATATLLELQFSLSGEGHSLLFPVLVGI
jgi:hypothetical protein